jgi:hypothetical protein
VRNFLAFWVKLKLYLLALEVLASQAFGLFVLDCQIFNKDHICQMYNIDLFRLQLLSDFVVRLQRNLAKASIENLSLPLQPSKSFALLDKL